MKVFVLGLDGATFECLNPLLDAGLLPNIRNVISEGATGALRTVFPPVTAPAWLALATGLNPGKTGVFDYINRKNPGSTEMIPISSRYYGKRAVWDHLNRAGYKVGVFNYPTLFPPPAVDGFSVSGMGWQEKGDLCFPREMADELQRLTGGYEVILNLRSLKYKKNIHAFFWDLDRLVYKQMKALKFLAQQKEWDFFFAVFSFTDWMQHVLWKYIDTTHQDHDATASRVVRENYERIWSGIDGFIGELTQMLPEDVAFLIVSDHGAGPLDSVFYANSWLESRGWLKKKQMGWKDLVARNLRLFSAGSDNKYANKILGLVRSKLLNLRSSIDLIDLDNSLAYSPEHNTMFGCINLTDRGKKLDGFREQLAEAIRRLPTIADGIREVQTLFPEDIYSGPHANLAPDILFTINGYSTTVEVDLVKDFFVNSPSLEMRTGGHRPDGVFIAHGEMFRSVKLNNLHVTDIAPTILALYGVGIPAQVDGKVITDCLRKEVLKNLEVSIGGIEAREEGLKEDHADMEEMKQMLQSLGYM